MVTLDQPDGLDPRDRLCTSEVGPGAGLEKIGAPWPPGRTVTSRSPRQIWGECRPSSISNAAPEPTRTKSRRAVSPRSRTLAAVAIPVPGRGNRQRGWVGAPADTPPQVRARLVLRRGAFIAVAAPQRAHCRPTPDSRDQTFGWGRPILTRTLRPQLSVGDRIERASIESPYLTPGGTLAGGGCGAQLARRRTQAGRSVSGVDVTAGAWGQGSLEGPPRVNGMERKDGVGR